MDRNTVGFSPVGTMCRGSVSSNLIQDTGSATVYVATTAAHETGHLLNMGHDDGRE